MMSCTAGIDTSYAEYQRQCIGKEYTTIVGECRGLEEDYSLIKIIK